jgi:Tol biopolymer transport system component
MRPIVPRLLLPLLILLALVAAMSPLAAFAQTETPPAAAEPGWGEMTPERRAQAIEYSNTTNLLYFVEFFYGLAIWLVLLFTGFSARMLAWAERIGKRRLLTLFLYLVALIAIVQIASLPLDYYSGFHLEHHYGLSNQTFGAWTLDLLKGLGVALVIIALLAVIVYAIIRRNPRSWWVWMGVVSVPLVIFFVIIGPIVITPIFYETKPMDDTPLRAQILNLAAQSGIPDSRVFVMDASKDTKKLNAYVTGLGKTKRIVLYDNLIAAMEPSEVLFVVGHEMGHYLLQHIWIGLGIAVAFIFIAAWLSHLAMSALIRRYHKRFGFERLSSFASMPLLALSFSVIGFLFSPLQNGIWRHFEHQADIFGLQKTADREAAVGAFEKLAATNLSNPDPSTFIKIWLYDHPTLAERVTFARSWQFAGSEAVAAVPAATADSALIVPGEKHFKNIRQLSFGGENAEAYFSADGQKLIFQSTRDGYPCDRIYTMNIDGSDVRMVSTGTGVTTCSFFAPDGERIVFCSTHLAGDSCPPKPSMAQGYVWALYAGYDVFSAKPDGSDLKRLTDTPGYDAEAVYSPDGSKILFTSVRNGDLDLYVMNPDGSNPVQLTHELGYDGGAFFSPDGKMICYRASHPTDSADIADYKNLLAQGLIRPSKLELWVMNADGTGKRQVTSNGSANFCPYFHPDGKRLIFSSSMNDPKKRNFDLFMINIDGTGLEQITFESTFDGFPMFNRDGTKLVFASNRNQAKPGETNIFIADWVE